MTAKDLARLLRISERTVVDWAQKGKIPGGKIGSVWRFRKDEIDRWLKERLVSPRLDEPGSVTIKDVLAPERVVIWEGKHSKEAVLKRLVGVLASADAVGDPEELEQAVFRREKLMSTGIGLGVAIPHVRIASVSEIASAVMLCPRGVDDYESLDGLPVKLVFMVAAGLRSHARYLRLVAAISEKIKSQDFRERLFAARDEEELFRLLCGD